MKAVTLRNLPRDLERTIRRKAQASGRSLNKTVIDLLEESTGLQKTRKKRVHHDLDSLAGAWSKREFGEFQRVIAEQRRIDEDL